MVNTFLKSYNWVSIYDIRPLNTRIYLDASLQGLGGCRKNFAYSILLPRGFNGYNIEQLEMLNAVVALKVWTFILLLLLCIYTQRNISIYYRTQSAI